MNNKKLKKIHPADFSTNSITDDFLLYHPTHSKYYEVWQRARFKLKFRLILSKLITTAFNKLNEDLNNFHREYETKSLGPYTNTRTINHEDLPFLMFYPEQRFINYWNVLISFSMIYTALIMPYYMAFMQTENSFGAFDIIDYIFSGIYFFDFLLNLCTIFYNSKGEIVMSRKKIFMRYLKSWMLVDILAFFPFDVLSVVPVRGKINPLFKLVRLPRLYKLLKISKVLKCLKQSHRYGIMLKVQDVLSMRHSRMRLLTSLITLIICVHVVTCLWVFTAKIEETNPNTWIFSCNLQDSDNDTLYLTSLYWTMTTFTTVGYGDVFGNSALENIFSIIWMIFSTQFLGFTIGSLSTLFNNLDTRDKILLNKLAVIDEFCEDANLPKQLRLKIRHSLRQSTCISGFSWSQKYSILAELPKTLRYEISLAMHRGAAKTIDFFANKNFVIVSEIIPYLSPVFINSNSFAYKSLDFPDELYFIVKGCVSYIFPKKNIPIYTTEKNDYFGDIELLLKIPRKYHALAKENLELLALSRSILNEIKKNYENVWYEMRGIAIQREKALRSSIADVLLLFSRKRISDYDRKKFQATQKLMKDMKIKFKYNKMILKLDFITNEDIDDKVKELNKRIEGIKKIFDLIKRKKRSSTCYSD